MILPGSPAADATRGLRVLHVVARLGLGGSERMAQTLAQGLAAEGVACGVLPVAGDNDATMAAAVRGELREHGVAVFPGSSRRSAKLSMLEAPIWLHRAVRGFDPDLIHLHTEIPEFAWAVSSLTQGRFARRPVVRTIHNAVLWNGWRRLGRISEERLDTATVVAVSAAAAEGFAAWRRSAGRPIRPVRVVYNGVPCSGSGAGIVRQADARPRLCFAGRFAREKGVDILLDALEILETSELGFEVVIFGTGREEADIRRRVQGLRRSVQIGPPVPNLRDRLAEFAAVIMPSRFEGLPLLAVETICAHVPLLAADAPGLREAVPPGYPGQFPPDDPPALARTIASFVTDPDPWRRTADAADTWARERFSVERMLGAYLEVYRSIVRPNASV